MRWLEWLTRTRREQELHDELRAHLSMAAADRVADGEAPDAARLAALKEFGNVTRTRDDARRAWAGGWRLWLFDLGQDVRYSIRLLARSPGYALVVLAVLALGIGANVSIFRLFRPLALDPVPGVSGSGRLGVLVARTSSGRVVPLSYLDFKDLVAAQRSFAAVAGTTLDSFSMGLGKSGERVWAEQVTGNYFQMLGVRAELGRTLQPSDDVAPGRHPVIVISDGLWRRAFGADPGILGRTVRIGGYPLTVVGVTEPAFHGTLVSVDVEAFIPIMMQPQIHGRDNLSIRTNPMLWGLGRLNPGTRLSAASAEADVLSARLAGLHPRADGEQRATVLSMWQSPFGAQTYMLPAVAVLGAMGVLVLLIVCANLSNLVLVRGLARRGEVAARLALGASRGRVLRLLWVESLVLAIPGAAAGLLASGALSLVLSRMSAPGVGAPGRVYLDASIEGTVIGFAFALSCACALLFGLLPALQVTRVDLASVMRDEASPRHNPKGRLRQILVVAQVAVSLTLLVAAGLVLRSLDSARHANPGFDARETVSVAIDLQSAGYDQTSGQAFYTTLLDRLRTGPGVESATLSSNTPMSVVPGRSGDFEIEGYVVRPDEELHFLVNSVAPDYFHTLRIPLVAGRDFEQTDDTAGRPVVVVNATLARRFWGSAPNALGKRLRVKNGAWAVVTGVVRDLKYLRLDEDPQPFVYFSFAQYPPVPMLVHVRGPQPLPALIERVRAEIRAMDANLPILDARPLAEQTELGLFVLVMVARLLAVFGGIAALLAAIGTYGLVSYAARQSRHEIGIRMAIGAARGDVVRRFLASGLRLGAMGVVVGVLVALTVSRGLQSVLYGVSATDLVSFSAACAALFGVVAAASVIPAWRAARTDPIAALRHR